MMKTKVHTYTYNGMQTLIEILCSDNWEIYIPLTLKARIKKGNGTLGRFDIAFQITTILCIQSMVEWIL